MFARKLLTGVVSTGLALSVVALTASSPASAGVAYNADADDATTAAPTATDLIGTGSDTTQGVVASIARAYNLTAGSSAGKLYTYAATAGNKAIDNNAMTGTPPVANPNYNPVDSVQLASKVIDRPIGSGPGIAQLLTTGEPQIAFARSSRELQGAELTNANSLQMFPFAKDTVLMAVQNPSSYAPAAGLTGAQIAAIYRCDPGARNWSAFGGANLTINPLLPKSGSGTRNFFLGELVQFNNNATLTPGTCVDQSVTEHDPAPITATAGSVAPFSLAKSGGKTTIKLLGGFSGVRAVYNIVRAADATKPSFQAIFGTGGFICSPAGKTAIEAAGFLQLLPTNKGGVCGQQTQTKTTNLLTEQADTATGVTVTSASASSARVIAKITSGGGTPGGTVTFFEGATAVASNVPLISGQATATPAAAPGAHTYRAEFTPAANSAFLPSTGAGTGTVQKATSATTASFDKGTATKVKGKTKVKKVKGTVSVVLTGTSTKAAGPVTITKGSKTVGTGTLSGGIASVKLSGLKVGKNNLTATYPGDANASGSAATFTVKVKLKK